jgi:hypothetical protein
MISDVLCETVNEVDRYLNDETMGKCYEGAMRDAILELKDRARAIHILLDYPPPLVDALVNQTDEATAYTTHLAKVLSGGERRAFNRLLKQLRTEQQSVDAARA